jgi:hypothetical protein
MRDLDTYQVNFVYFREEEFGQSIFILFYSIDYE